MVESEESKVGKFLRDKSWSLIPYTLSTSALAAGMGSAVYGAIESYFAPALTGLVLIWGVGFPVGKMGKVLEDSLKYRRKGSEEEIRKKERKTFRKERVIPLSRDLSRILGKDCRERDAIDYKLRHFHQHNTGGSLAEACFLLENELDRVKSLSDECEDYRCLEREIRAQYDILLDACQKVIEPESFKMYQYGSLVKK